MNINDVMAELENLGTAQNRKVYQRHGASEPLFGVSFANLDAMAKKIKKAVSAEQRQELHVQAAVVLQVPGAVQGQVEVPEPDHQQRR